MNRTRLIIAILAASSAFGCGKKRILMESNRIQLLASDSLNLANDIVVSSPDPAAVSLASEIAANQEEILSRSQAVSLATASIEDKADDISAWWGDFFLGTVENVKWVAITVLIAVVAFIGYRARIWSLLGSLLKPFRSSSS